MAGSERVVREEAFAWLPCFTGYQTALDHLLLGLLCTPALLCEPSCPAGTGPSRVHVALSLMNAVWPASHVPGKSRASNVALTCCRCENRSWMAALLLMEVGVVFSPPGAGCHRQLFSLHGGSTQQKSRCSCRGHRASAHPSPSCACGR